MTLEEQFRNGLAGQLSNEKTDVDIRVAVKIARGFAVDFLDWCGEKTLAEVDLVPTEELLKIFEDEVYGK